MFPPCASYGIVNSRARHAELSRERGRATIASRIARAQFLHHLIGKAGVGIVRALDRRARLMTRWILAGTDSPVVAIPAHILILLDRVACVIRPVPQVEMGRIAASAIVPTGAVVQHPQPIGDFAIGQNPGDTIRAAIFAPPFDDAVAVETGLGYPRPAREQSTRLIDLRPESVGKGLRAGAVATGCRAMLSPPSIVGDEGLMATGANRGKVKGHRGTLLTRVFGAAHRTVSSSRGAFCCLNYTIWTGNLPTAVARPGECS